MDLRQAQASGVIVGRRMRRSSVGSRNELRGSRFEGTGSNTGSKLDTDLTILDGGQKLTSVARTLFDDSRPKGAAAGEEK